MIFAFLRGLFTSQKATPLPTPQKTKSKDTTPDLSAFAAMYAPPQRAVSKVFLHCSASDRPEHDNIETITQWHIARRFSGIGYHYFIDKKGVIHKGRDLEKDPAAQAGHNKGSIAICVSGLAVFTPESLLACKLLCQHIDIAHKRGTLTFHGHKEVANKECPVFDYFESIGINKKTHKLLPN